MPFFIILALGLVFGLDLNRDGVPDAVAALNLYGLEKLVQVVDVTVVLGALPAGWLGAYHHKRRTITMREGLTPAWFRSVLAHELGHAYMDHAGYHLPESMQEKSADRFAAKHLIRMDDYHAALARTGGDIRAMADELNVMPWVVREFSTTTSGGLFARVGITEQEDERALCAVTDITGLVDTRPLILGNNVLL